MFWKIMSYFGTASAGAIVGFMCAAIMAVNNRK